MAVLGAFLLFAATTAGTSTSLPGAAAGGMNALTAGTLLEKPQAEPQVEQVRAMRHNKRFKISLYLFRRN